MFKIIKPRLSPAHVITVFPHCDQRVLHAPGECQFCDQHAEWQELRLAWGIAFTGWEAESNESPCPATMLRSVDTINKWGGNRAMAPGEPL